MTRLLFALPAPTIYDIQQRVISWRHTPASREGLKQLKEMVPRLLELGVTRVVASDLDEQSAKALARKLNVPCELWQSLRRFNWGAHHGAKQDKFDRVRAKVEETWKTNSTVPVKGGDSKASYLKRMVATRERLLTANRLFLVLAGPTEITALVGANGKLEHGHVYEVELG